MGRSVLPLLAGFLEYDREHLIKGVILNRVGKAFGETLASLIRETLQLPVLGCFPEQKTLGIESRHLGLKLPGEVERLRERVKSAARELEKTLDLQMLLEIADQAENVDFRQTEQAEDAGSRTTEREEKVRIGIARDEAFCFYYEDNLRILGENGAELVPFSPLWDQELPEDLDGILLGGGYPEIWTRQLEANEGMRRGIREALESGMPSIAECGGFLYLHEELTTPEGEVHTMCGVLPGCCQNTGKLTRFGYVTLRQNPEPGINPAENSKGFLLPDQQIRAHEFHHYDSPVNGNACIAEKPASGRKWECIHADETHWWGFPHLYYPSNPQFVQNFIAAAKAYKNCQQP